MAKLDSLVQFTGSTGDKSAYRLNSEFSGRTAMYKKIMRTMWSHKSVADTYRGQALLIISMVNLGFEYEFEIIDLIPQRLN